MIKQKIQDLLDELNQGLVEREAAVKAILLSVLAAENMVLIGPPGTGKSMVARRVAEVFQANHETQSESDYFEYLLTKFSTPEEIFGPLSITELKADRFKRNTTGYLPSVRMAFLDEIFKASSSILNSLLTILNERVYHNGAEAQQVPLVSLIAASNELPTGQEELAALYDRFLIRSFVDYVSADNMVLLFENKSPESLKNRLTHKDIDAIQRSASSVKIPNEIAEAVQRIWTEHKETFKEDSREYLSDRRLKKIVQLLRISAATNDRQEVNLSDVVLLKDCLWNHQENARKVKDIIFDVLKKYNKRVLQETVKKNNNSQSAHSHSHAKQDAIIKGFKGRGTQDDPLLVESVEHLMDLNRPEVGQNGYYFRQMAHIDCSEHEHWNEISKFIGSYDGNMFSIKGPTESMNIFRWGVVLNESPDDTARILFSKIDGDSNVKRLVLDNLTLAKNVFNSRISRCSTNRSLLAGYVDSCRIECCSAKGYLVDGSINATKISCCSSEFILVSNEVSRSSIVNCHVNVYKSYDCSHDVNNIGCVVRFLTENSKVQNCFVSCSITNRDSGNIYLSGIADDCFESAIENCAVGQIDVTNIHVRVKNRIVDEYGLRDSILKNNVSIHTNSGTSDSAGADGRTIDKSLFNQRLFEHSLGWDFESIWQWNDQLERPELRLTSAEADADDLIQKTLNINNSIAERLGLEIKDNIWL